MENNPTECAQSATDYPGDPNSITLADFLEDGRAATRALHETLDQDVVIIGHSNGAMYVPLLGVAIQSAQNCVEAPCRPISIPRWKTSICRFMPRLARPI